MSRHPERVIAADRRRIQRSALRAGLWVGLASAAVVGLVTTAILLTMLAASRPGRRPRDGGRAERILRVDDVMPIAILLGLLGVVALGVIAWHFSRRAAEPLAEALGVQRAFVADASHELRTPLTTLTSRIQLAQHRLRHGGDVDPVLEDLRRDAAVMDAVLTDLLLAAESAGADRDHGGADASVGQAVDEALATIALRAQLRGVGLSADVPPGLRAAAEPTALARAIVALLDNAVRHAPEGSTVRIRARAAGRRAEIRVADEGPGLGGADPERIFERFSRADGPGSRDQRGFGLGLALVRDIAARFGGTVEVESTSTAGTVFLLAFPRPRGVREGAGL